jgi:hypothetical protein
MILQKSVKVMDEKGNEALRGEMQGRNGTGSMGH